MSMTASWSHKKNNIQNYYKFSLIGLVLIICLVFVVTSSAFFSQAINKATNTLSSTTNNILSSTTQLVSNTIGKAMKQDTNGKINVLLVWYWGDWHAGWYLADSIIVASFDPKEYSVAMISIPRDLIVNQSGSINKINSVMAYSYNRSKDITIATQTLINKITDITGLEIPYYTLIDFDGFSSLVNKIGGIDVNVPQSIIDRTYPWPNYSYITFSIKSWLQHLDGATALKYARSRHSSSDFSRSQRQQLIIKAITEKLVQDGLSINNLQSIYETYQEYVTTNISLDEMLGLLAYGKTIPPMFSFWYTYECNNSAWKTMQAACMLYPVVQEQFNGMSGMLPIGASIGKISFYDNTKRFADFVSNNQWLFKENFTFSLYNAIDSSYAKKFPYRNNIASNLAIKMKRYGLSVNDVITAEQPSSGTIIMISGSGEYQETLKSLSEFLTIDTVKFNEATVDMSGNALPNHIDIYLGNTFIEEFWNQRFTTYLTNAQQSNQ